MSSVVGRTQLAHARLWHLIDARGQVLGRLGTHVASVLMGKHKRAFNPSIDIGDHVVIINAKDVRVTGRKEQQKVYRSHSQQPGGLKEIPYALMAQKRPETIIEKAVSGMLPKNKLRDRRLERLYVFPDEKHPYAENIIKRHDEHWPVSS